MDEVEPKKPGRNTSLGHAYSGRVILNVYGTRLGSSDAPAVRRSRNESRETARRKRLLRKRSHLQVQHGNHARLRCSVQSRFQVEGDPKGFGRLR